MASKTVARIISLLGLLFIFAGIALVLLGARVNPAPVYGPPRVWLGFLVGLLGLALTARGATMPRY